jgi:hypothetical protein
LKVTVLKALPADLYDGLLAEYKKPEDLIGENGLVKQITKAVVERALQAELADNGNHKKTLKGEFGELPIELPRERHGSFEPQCDPGKRPVRACSNTWKCSTTASVGIRRIIMKPRWISNQYTKP